PAGRRRGGRRARCGDPWTGGGAGTGGGGTGHRAAGVLGAGACSVTAGGLSRRPRGWARFAARGRGGGGGTPGGMSVHCRPLTRVVRLLAPARRPRESAGDMGGGFSIWHLLVVLIVAMLLFGAGRVADLGKGLGEGIKSFKKGLREDDEPAPKP